MEVDDDDELEDDDENELGDVLGLQGGAAMKAMKKKAMKKLTARTAKRLVFAGKLAKTPTGLTKADLVKNKYGKVVSKKHQARGNKNPWLQAVQKARAALKVKGMGIV